MGAVGLILRIIIFFGIFLYLGLKVIDKILDLGEKIHLPKAFLSISLSILLIYAFFADKAGISGIIGAFVAGVLIGQSVRSVKIEGDLKAIAYGFFIPLFFVGVGASLWKNLDGEFSGISDVILLALVISLVAIIGKIIGSGIGAKIGGMSTRESLQVGIGMIPRMELALIIAAAAVSNEVVTEAFAHQILLITVIITIVTTIVAPLLIKATFKNS
jgi:Kef-type K+ transport system membrane component KefB